jgi:hypothetical protein
MKAEFREQLKSLPLACGSKAYSGIENRTAKLLPAVIDM